MWKALAPRGRRAGGVSWLESQGQQQALLDPSLQSAREGKAWVVSQTGKSQHDFTSRRAIK